MTTQHPITPHKGGRNAAFPRTRLTPEVREMLDKLLELHGISASDWITPLIIDEYQRTFEGKTK